MGTAPKRLGQMGPSRRAAARPAAGLPAALFRERLPPPGGAAAGAPAAALPLPAARFGGAASLPAALPGPLPGASVAAPSAVTTIPARAARIPRAARPAVAKAARPRGQAAG